MALKRVLSEGVSFEGAKDDRVSWGGMMGVVCVDRGRRGFTTGICGLGKLGTRCLDFESMAADR